MGYIILVIYILGILGSLVFLGIVREDSVGSFIMTLIWPIVLGVFSLFLFFRSFYVFGQYLNANTKESFGKYWSKKILEF